MIRQVKLEGRSAIDLRFTNHNPDDKSGRPGSRGVVSPDTHARVKARIDLAVPGRPIGPWSRRTAAPQASATRREELQRRIRRCATRRWSPRTGLTPGRAGSRHLHVRAGRSRRPCHPRAISSGHQRYPADIESRSSSLRSQTANASTVLAALYLRRLKRRSTACWMRRRAGWNSAATAKVAPLPDAGQHRPAQGAPPPHWRRPRNKILPGIARWR